jgi:hypothetical protein
LAGNVLDLKDVIIEDQLGCRISQYFIEWGVARQKKITDWEELRRYIYATDTSQTSNNSLPWKNKTTIPKLCQIRDNLYANYLLSLFPKRKWLTWEGGDESSNTKQKRETIQNYVTWCIENRFFKKELSKLILDYIDYGNCFATVDWMDNTVELEDKTQVGYVGPYVKRISPLDIVFNPIAESFEKSPKIVRSMITLGEVKEMLERFSSPENKEQYEELYKYIRGLRHAAQGTGETKTLDDYYRVDGFHSFRHYLQSDYVELLTFCGDLYDYETDTFLRNYIITVVDRHKVILKRPNPSFSGQAEIRHCGWRPRQDNLWAMGPLDNLVGMQYRIDHIENLKADVFDLITFPPLKIKGYVDDFEWGPFAKIFVGDDGDVEILAPPFQVLQANLEIEMLERKMEEMAGAPKEALGFRSPGEKTKYEVQRIENAQSRIYTNRTAQFEELFVEPILNDLLELGRRRMTKSSIRVLDDEFQIASFQELTPDDLVGVGRLKPLAARHFAEKADIIQNLSQFFSTPVGQDPAVSVHFSGIKTAKLFEDLLDISEYKLVEPYIRISEQQDSQRQMQAGEEQVMMEGQTPSGLSQDDFDEGI